MARPLGPGARIDRFEIVRLLGAGGMGAVYEARDPELARSVALKLIHEPDTHKSLRFLREAQALAQLQHPNVVAVYEVGTDGDEVFIAMELVDGTSLDRLSPRPASWREVVALFVQAGRGLVVAHDKGLVHRDVKPSNLLVDRSGRVRIGDFGLARLADGAVGAALEAPPSPTAVTVEVGSDPVPRSPAPSGDGLLASPLTGAGAVVGTPLYMAPELFAGRPATARSDQYSFCVALRELLPPRMPRWLARAVDRGCAPDPAARHSSMVALVDLLEREPLRRRRLVIGAVAGAGVVAAAVTIAVASARPPADPCAGAGRRVAGIWDARRRVDVEASLLAVDPEQGARRFATAGGALDRFADAWTTMHVDVCRANRVTGAESDTLSERRMRCLDRRLTELSGASAALASARDLAAVDRAVVAAQQLGSLDACADAEALLAVTPPPDDPAARRAVDAILDELDAIDALRRQGAVTGLDARSAAAVEQARATGHAPALAAALRVRAQVLIDSELGADASAALRELTEVAAEAHDDAGAAWAWTELLRTVGYVEGKHGDAAAFLPAARAAVKRTQDDPVLEVRFLANEAIVLQLGGHPDDALARLAEARGVLERAGAREPGSTLIGALAGLAYRAAALDYMAGRYADAERGFHEAVDVSVQAFGPDHPEAATAWHALGEALRVQVRAEESLAAYDEALRIRAARLGETPAVANTLVAQAGAYQLLDRFPDALAALERAERILRGAPGAAPADLASAIMTSAAIYAAMGKQDDARRRYDDAIGLYGTLGGEHVNLGIVHYNRGELAAASGRCADAVDDHRRAVELFTEQLGDQHPNLVFPLSSMGCCQVLLGHHADALATLDRALAIPSGDDAALSRFQARVFRGRALVESGRDRAGGLRAVREAIDEMATVEAAAAVRAKAVAWLRSR